MAPMNALNNWIKGNKITIKSKEIIDSKMSLAKKQFPINALGMGSLKNNIFCCYGRVKKKLFYFLWNPSIKVKMKNISQDLKKRSDSHFWSTAIFRIRGFKRPVFDRDPVGIYLKRCDTNKYIDGIFYPHELKVVL